MEQIQDSQNSMQNPKHVDNAAVNIPRKTFDGRTLQRKTVGPDKVTALDQNAITQSQISSNAIGVAQLKYHQVTVTVNAGNATGTASVIAGDVILGWYATAQDQIVQSIAIASTTLTVTLLANATGNNIFVITLLKV